jgi:alkylhydroperoxidase/carboxymuconolactone decarboxylase family protein YurZ
MHDYRAVLRRLALKDDRFIASLLAEERACLELSGLDAQSHAFVRLGALVAMDAPPAAFMGATDAALAAGATNEEIVGTLIALLPVVGVTRVVAAAPNLGLALGYDVGEALELLDNGELRG